MSEVVKFKEATWLCSSGIAEDGKPFIKRVRTDIQAPVNGLSHESFITIKFQYPENGLPADKENAALDNIEEVLLKQLEDLEIGRLVYVQTYDSHRVFLFYTKEDLSKGHDNIFYAIPEKYNVSLLADLDPEWKFLFEVKNALEKKLEKRPGG